MLEHLRYSYDFIKIAWSSGQIFKSATRLTPRDAELVAKVFVVKAQSLRISSLFCNLNHCVTNLLVGTDLTFVTYITNIISGEKLSCG